MAIFSLGKVLITPGAIETFDHCPDLTPGELLRRHMSGDWGELDPEEWASNNRALGEGTLRCTSASRRIALAPFATVSEDAARGPRYSSPSQRDRWLAFTVRQTAAPSPRLTQTPISHSEPAYRRRNSSRI
jgi:hypothetical protein